MSSGKAGGVGLALLLAAMAGVGWVAAGAIPGRSNGGEYVEVAAVFAAVLFLLFVASVSNSQLGN